MDHSGRMRHATYAEIDASTSIQNSQVDASSSNATITVGRL